MESWKDGKVEKKKVEKTESWKEEEAKIHKDGKLKRQRAKKTTTSK